MPLPLKNAVQSINQPQIMRQLWMTTHGTMGLVHGALEMVPLSRKCCTILVVCLSKLIAANHLVLMLKWPNIMLKGTLETPHPMEIQIVNWHLQKKKMTPYFAFITPIMFDAMVVEPKRVFGNFLLTVMNAMCLDRCRTWCTAAVTWIITMVWFFLDFAQVQQMSRVHCQQEHMFYGLKKKNILDIRTEGRI